MATGLLGKIQLHIFLQIFLYISKKSNSIKIIPSVQKQSQQFLVLSACFFFFFKEFLEEFGFSYVIMSTSSWWQNFKVLHNFSPIFTLCFDSALLTDRHIPVPSATCSWPGLMMWKVEVFELYHQTHKNIYINIYICI